MVTVRSQERNAPTLPLCWNPETSRTTTPSTSCVRSSASSAETPWRRSQPLIKGEYRSTSRCQATKSDRSLSRSSSVAEVSLMRPPSAVETFRRNVVPGSSFAQACKLTCS